jgi:hypothetical protein
MVQCAFVESIVRKLFDEYTSELRILTKMLMSFERSKQASNIQPLARSNLPLFCDRTSSVRRLGRRRSILRERKRAWEVAN